MWSSLVALRNYMWAYESISYMFCLRCSNDMLYHTKICIIVKLIVYLSASKIHEKNSSTLRVLRHTLRAELNFLGAAVAVYAIAMLEIWSNVCMIWKVLFRSLGVLHIYLFTTFFTHVNRRTYCLRHSLPSNFGECGDLGR